jgi:hypothetical protein
MFQQHHAGGRIDSRFSAIYTTLGKFGPNGSPCVI